MRCAFGVGVAIFLSYASLSSRPSAPRDDGSRRALMVNLSPFTEGTVRRAIDLARRRLARPDCRLVYDDFELPDGRTPRAELDRLGIPPEEWLESLTFTDGSDDAVCRGGYAALTTTPRSRLIRVCPSFAQLNLQDSGRSAVLVIHESLHALGLGENPPTSNQITQRVDRRCW